MNTPTEKARAILADAYRDVRESDYADVKVQRWFGAVDMMHALLPIAAANRLYAEVTDAQYAAESAAAANAA